MTICPLAGFKQSGFHYKVNDIMNNTITLRDIVHNPTYENITSNIYEEPLGQQIGRCFSYYSNEGIEMNSGKHFYFKTDYDLRIFFHQKGDELWFTGFYEFPYEVSSVTLDITKRENIGLASISLREVWSVMYSKPEMPCKDYDAGTGSEHELFAKCSKDALWKVIHSNFTCRIPDMKQMIPKNSSFPECNNRDEATKVYVAFIDLMQNLTPFLSHHGCPLPCKYVSYQLKTEFFHKNNLFFPHDPTNLTEKYFDVYPFWSVYPTEEKIETLECDFTNFLVSAGGNLGLFLGFSCLSVLFSFIDWIQAKFWPGTQN